jgi:hypothetical protein
LRTINFSSNQPRLWLEIFLWRRGYIWLVLVFLVLAALSVKFFFLPLQLHIELSANEDFRQSKAQRLNSEKALPASAITAKEAAVLMQLKTVFLIPEDVSDVLRRIVKIARKNNVFLTQSQFQKHSNSLSGFRQLKVVFPIRSKYINMRMFVEQVLLENPSVSLDQLLMQRENSAQNQADIQIRLSLWIKDEKTNEIFK